VLATMAPWVALVRRVLPDRRAWVVAAAAPAGLITLLDGQNAFLTASLAGFALLSLERRPAVAGVLIGLLALKPQLGVLFPLALFAQSRWRAVAAAAATVMALALLSLALFGIADWAAFFRDLPVAEAIGDAGAVPWGTMPSAEIFVRSLGGPVGLAHAVQAATALVAALCVWRAWRCRDAPFEAKAATLAVASLLVPPYLFYYDLLWAALAIGLLVRLALRDGFRRGERMIFLFAYVAPAAMPPVQLLTHVQLGFPALVLLLAAALRRAAPPTAAERNRLRRAVDALRVAPWLTRRRLLLWGAVCAAVAVILLARNVAFHTTNGFTAADGSQLAGDFATQFAGAKAAAAGGGARVYDPVFFNAYVARLVGPSGEFKFYPFPPFALLLMLPLAAVPFVPALMLWVAAGVGASFALLRRLIDGRMAALAVVAAPPAFVNLFYWENGHITAALLAGGLMALGRRPGLAGICFGCLAYKPQMAILLPFALAAGRCWRALGAAAATILLLSLASLAVFGAAAWTQWLAHTALNRAMLEQGAAFWPFRPTVFAAARVVGASVPVAYLAQLPSSAAALAATLFVWRRSGPFAIKAAVVIVATLLATPYAWDYDAVASVFAAAWLGREALRSGLLPWDRIAILGLLAWPAAAIPAARLLGLPLAPLLLWLALAVLVRRALPARGGVGAGVLAD
jgi:alpha-1,2-mannosyltransferase